MSESETRTCSLDLGPYYDGDTGSPLQFTSSTDSTLPNDPMTVYMSYHAKYLDPFLRTHNYIMRGDGPLPFPIRNYIAIMAAARHQCTYLIEMQKQEFIENGGANKWLEGLHQIPQKIRDLNDINKLLAHQPWHLNKGHIQKLAKCSDSWSLSELVHAMVILVHFHSLSSFVFGCGLNDAGSSHNHQNNVANHSQTSDNSSSTHNRTDESANNGNANGHTTSSVNGHTKDKGVSPANNGSSEQKTGQKRAPPSPPTPPHHHNNGAVPRTGSTGGDRSPNLQDSASALQLEELYKKMQSFREQEGIEAMTPEELIKDFERVESVSADLEPFHSHDCSHRQIMGSNAEEVAKFVEDPTFTYMDFARRANASQIPTFRIKDYSWDKHGFSLVNRLYNDIGNLLDEKFKVTYNLTYQTMGGKTGVDTTPFRRAIWNYIHCIFGIRHDDYDYRQVNELLERQLKSYCKTVSCFPERVGKRDIDAVMVGFRRPEKIHVNLMIAESRMQAELLYGLHAVMQYMT